jgi:hypothetical protein
MSAYLARVTSWVHLVAVAGMLACASGSDIQPPDGLGGEDGDEPGASPDAGAKKPKPKKPTVADAGTPPVVTPAGCPILTYPSGVSLQTRTDAALTNSYDGLTDEDDYPTPTCFVDTDNLVDAKNGKKYDLNVKLSEHFTLAEYVGRGLAYSHRILLSPELVTKVELFRMKIGRSIAISSGYRSPGHQRSVCRSLSNCGRDFCPGICAKRSRHSWGDAVDFPENPTVYLGESACAAKFNFVFREGDHLHSDLNPAHEICTREAL